MIACPCRIFFDTTPCLLSHLSKSDHAQHFNTLGSAARVQPIQAKCQAEGRHWERDFYVRGGGAPGTQGACAVGTQGNSCGNSLAAMPGTPLGAVSLTAYLFIELEPYVPPEQASCRRLVKLRHIPKQVPANSQAWTYLHAAFLLLGMLLAIFVNSFFSTCLVVELWHLVYIRLPGSYLWRP